ncbi:MAG: hypothetical protein ABSC45_01150 [Desulfobaccales bacterium]|jgi:hypothetical protein
MEKKTRLAWEEFLNPDVLRQNLILASIYIAYFEILKDSIIDRPKEFFATEWNQGEPNVSEKYRDEILNRNKSPIYSSLSWYKENGVIDSTDLDRFTVIKSCRNELAHELKYLITKGIELRFLEAFKDLIALLNKIEVWWIANVEIPTDEDFADKEINESEIITGPILMLQVILDVALGDEDRSRFYFQEFTKLINEEKINKSSNFSPL